MVFWVLSSVVSARRDGTKAYIAATHLRETIKKYTLQNAPLFLIRATFFASATQ
jgi:hypothetical protein